MSNWKLERRKAIKSDVVWYFEGPSNGWNAVVLSERQRRKIWRAKIRKDGYGYFPKGYHDINTDGGMIFRLLYDSPAWERVK